ncbi:MAG: GNAT family N-acetyltransferase [Planctomycetes bacterium]|nr:GNAT family N-acetyltransferase [Planctomycetota bacterium]
MPRVDAVVECPVHDSFRVQQVAGMFDVPLEEKLRDSFSVEIPAADEDWSIGAIVGPSGSGKSTIARKAFGKELYGYAAWPEKKAVIDCFGERSIRDITHVLTAVGFSSPPSWVKPYRVLSNGEKFRCELARALLEDGELIAFDEFTSVVDRVVGKIGSAAVSKAIRSGKIERKFVAITCHYDVLEWLEPDWVVDMATSSLERGRLRRPEITIEVFRCHHSAWNLFSKHHYLDAKNNRASHCYLATWQDIPVAFCSVLPKIGMKNMWRLSRTVVLPDYQGIGIGSRLSEAVAQLYKDRGCRLVTTTSNPAMIAHRVKSPLWRVTSVLKTGGAVWRSRKKGYGDVKTSAGRAVVSFEYLGS